MKSGATGNNLYLLKTAECFNQAGRYLKRKMDHLKYQWVNTSLIANRVSRRQWDHCVLVCAYVAL